MRRGPAFTRQGIAAVDLTLHMIGFDCYYYCYYSVAVCFLLPHHQAFSLARHSGQLAGNLDTVKFIELALEWSSSEEAVDERKTKGGGSQMSKAWFLSWMAGLLESLHRETRLAAAPPNEGIRDDDDDDGGDDNGDEDSSQMDRLAPFLSSACSDILASSDLKDNSSRIALGWAWRETKQAQNWNECYIRFTFLNATYFRLALPFFSFLGRAPCRGGVCLPHRVAFLGWNSPIPRLCSLEPSISASVQHPIILDPRQKLGHCWRLPFAHRPVHSHLSELDTLLGPQLRLRLEALRFSIVWNSQKGHCPLSRQANDRELFQAIHDKRPGEAGH